MIGTVRVPFISGMGTVLFPSRGFLAFVLWLGGVHDQSWNYQVSMVFKNGLTLKGPIMTAADDKFCDIFPNFLQK